MQFTPKTEKEIAEENLWPVGEYGFEITEAYDKVSNSGNEMIELKLKVFNAEGGFKFIRDYLLESLSYKLRHAATACGAIGKYESGQLVAGDFVGATGFVKLGIDKDKTGKYPDKNAVKDYVTQEDASQAPPPGHPAAASFEDEIQF